MLSPRLSKAIDMPKDKGLGLFRACSHADLYKARNESCRFIVVNEDNGDVEYSV